MKWMRGLRGGTPRKNRLRITIEMLCTAFQLTGDDGGLVGSPVVVDFHEVGACLAVDACHSPIIEQQYVSLGQGNQPLAKRPVAVANP